jgi:hypothetical protein
MDALGHEAPRYHCETCRRRFDSREAANHHMRALDHYKDDWATC